MNPFHRRSTKNAFFYVSNAEKVRVRMMNIVKKFPFATLDLEQSKVKMIELPYVGDRIVMQILIPHEHIKRGESNIDSIFSTIKEEGVDVGSLFNENQKKIEVIVKLPKFKITYSRDLSGDLKRQGMKNMFTRGVADFSGIDGTRSLYVSIVKQDVVIEVNEKGSEAVAATAVAMSGFRSVGIKKEEFFVDQPFLFFIKDKQTGMLLFLGKIVNPVKMQ